jgi:uncharacterized protein YodC (DUF2158 family)
MTEESVEFQVGDVVRLVSGDSPMTIASIKGKGAYCVFIGEPPKGFYKTEYVSLAVLRKVENPVDSK